MVHCAAAFGFCPDIAPYWTFLREVPYELTSSACAPLLFSNLKSRILFGDELLSRLCLAVAVVEVTMPDAVSVDYQTTGSFCQACTYLRSDVPVRGTAGVFQSAIFQVVVTWAGWLGWSDGGIEAGNTIP